MGSKLCGALPLFSGGSILIYNHRYQVSIYTTYKRRHCFFKSISLVVKTAMNHCILKASIVFARHQTAHWNILNTYVSTDPMSVLFMLQIYDSTSFYGNSHEVCTHCICLVALGGTGSTPLLNCCGYFFVRNNIWCFCIWSMLLSSLVLRFGSLKVRVRRRKAGSVRVSVYRENLSFVCQCVCTAVYCTVFVLVPLDCPHVS